MSLLDDIGYHDNIKLIALIGGGGKTTLMYRLARELYSIGKNVVCTTTTHIMKPTEDFPFPVRGVPLPDNPQKLSALSEKEFSHICTEYDVVLVEADGSRGLPLKLPASHEPVIPPDTDLVLCIAGIDAIGKSIAVTCHRPHIVSDFLHKSPDMKIAPQDIARILPMLCGDKLPKHAKKLTVLNKVNTLQDNLTGKEIEFYMKENNKGARLIMTGNFTSPKLIIAGGGHVGLATAKIGAIAGMDVTVIEPRKELITPERFPMCKVLCGEFTDMLAQDFGENAYYVIVTRGHAADLECLNIIKKKPYRYVGMIGSRRKTAYVMDEMKKLGWQDKQLTDIHAPIGLNIGAITPEEIAVSIIAEIIQEMNKNGGEKIPADVAKALNHVTEPMVLAAIIHKEGSAPRGEGSCMLVKADGSIIGTIGGGIVEYKSIQFAVDMLKNNYAATEKEYSLNQDDESADSVCGGRIKVKFEVMTP